MNKTARRKYGCPFVHLTSLTSISIFSLVYSLVCFVLVVVPAHAQCSSAHAMQCDARFVGGADVDGGDRLYGDLAGVGPARLPASVHPSQAG